MLDEWAAAGMAVGAAPEALQDQIVKTLGFATAGFSVLAGLALLAAIKAGFIGLSLWLTASQPGLTKRALYRYQFQGRRCVLVGLVNILFGSLIAVILVTTKVLAFVAVLMLLGMGLLAVVGYGAAYRHLGLRLFGPNCTSVRSCVLGGIVAESAFLAPVLGQLYSLGVLVRGFGAAVLALLSTRAVLKAETTPETHPEA